jgi:hypothetical protein
MTHFLMAAQDMTDAFQNPHTDAPFASVGDDTIAALSDLAAIFKLKLQPTPSHASHASPPKVVQRPSHIPSQLPATRQTRSQKTIQNQESPKASVINHDVTKIMGK